MSHPDVTFTPAPGTVLVPAASVTLTVTTDPLATATRVTMIAGSDRGGGDIADLEVTPGSPTAGASFGLPITVPASGVVYYSVTILYLGVPGTVAAYATPYPTTTATATGSAVLFTSPPHAKLELGTKDTDLKSPPDSQESPDLERLLSAKIGAASSMLADDFACGGYPSMIRELTGTVATDGTVNVIGDGTLFTAELFASSGRLLGSVLSFGRLSYAVDTILDDENLTLTEVADSSIAGATASTVSGDASTADQIAHFAAVLVADLYTVATHSREKGVNQALERLKEWRDRVRAGNACFTDEDGNPLSGPVSLRVAKEGLPLDKLQRATPLMRAAAGAC